jgi:ribosomal protein L16/L10AE
MAQNTNLHATAFPTHPVQDNLGQLIIQFGLSKLEYLAAIVSVGYINTNSNMLPETIAEASLELAEAILNLSEEKAKNDLTKKTPTIKLN